MTSPNVLVGCAAGHLPKSFLLSNSPLIKSLYSRTMECTNDANCIVVHRLPTAFIRVHAYKKGKT